MNGVMDPINGKTLPFPDHSLADTASTFSSYYRHHTEKPVLQVSDLHLFKAQTAISTYQRLSAGTETKAQQTST